MMLQLSKHQVARSNQEDEESDDSTDVGDAPVDERWSALMQLKQK